MHKTKSIIITLIISKLIDLSGHNGTNQFSFKMYLLMLELHTGIICEDYMVKKILQVNKLNCVL